jgi:hypothetical protein
VRWEGKCPEVTRRDNILTSVSKTIKTCKIAVTRAQNQFDQQLDDRPRNRIRCFASANKQKNTITYPSFTFQKLDHLISRFPFFTDNL